MKTYSGYSISRGYTLVTIWHFSRMTKSRLMTTTRRPSKGLSRYDKFIECCGALRDHSLPCPCYREKETPRHE